MKSIKHNIHSWSLLLLAFLLIYACKHEAEPQEKSIQALFEKGCAAQSAGNNTQAISLFQKCQTQSIQLEKSSTDDAPNDSVADVFVRSLVQLLNAYQSEGKADDCVSYFRHLKQQTVNATNPLLSSTQRNVYIIYAYALSRTEATEMAAHVADSALQMELYNPTPDRLLRDYSYAAAIYYCQPDHQKQMVEVGEKALEELQHCQNKRSGQWIINLIGAHYQRIGEVEKAINLYEHGYDIAEEAHDTIGMVNVVTSLANYMLDWGLVDEANGFSEKAIRLLSNLHEGNPMVATQAYIAHAKVMKLKGNDDKALQMLYSAARSSVPLPYNSGKSDIDLSMGQLMTEPNSPNADYANGVERLKHAAQEGTCGIRARAYFELAKLAYAKGNNADCETNLDSMYVQCLQYESPLQLTNAYQFALDFYLKIDNAQKVKAYASLLNKQQSEQKSNAATRALIQSLVHMKTKDTQHQLDQERHDAQYLFITLGLCLLLATVLMAWGIVKYRHTTKNNRLLKNNLEEARSSLVSQQQADIAAAAISRETESEAHKEALQSIVVADVMRDKGEAYFRKMFVRAYPRFLPALRQSIANLTPKEEILCMLIALNKTNQEIRDILNIERRSVNMAKYRIRRKIDLPKDQSLEEYILSLMHE